MSIRVRMCAAFLAIVAGGAEREPAWAEHRPLRIAYVYDCSRHAAANREGQNYWDMYLREIGDQLGVRMEEASPAVLRSPPNDYARYATLLMGNLAPEDIPSGRSRSLDRWIRGGGTLIAFATQGMDDLCGNRCVGQVRQPGDRFTCAATFAVRSHALTQDIHSTLQPSQRLLIFSDVQKTMLAGSFNSQRSTTFTGRTRVARRLRDANSKGPCVLLRLRCAATDVGCCAGRPVIGTTTVTASFAVGRHRHSPALDSGPLCRRNPLTPWEHDRHAAAPARAPTATHAEKVRFPMCTLLLGRGRRRKRQAAFNWPLRTGCESTACPTTSTPCVARTTHSD